MFTPRGTGGVEANNALQQQATAQQQAWTQQDRDRAKQYQGQYDTMNAQGGSLYNLRNSLANYLGGGGGNPLSSAPEGSWGSLAGGSPWNINTNQSAGLPQYQTGQLQNPSAYAWTTSDISAVPNAANMPKFNATDWLSQINTISNPLLQAYQLSPEMQGQINPNLDIAGTGQDVYNAYLRSGNQSIADQYQSLGDQAQLDAARRGLSSTSMGPNAQTALSIQRGQGVASNEANALSQRLGVESGLRGEQRTGATTLADLLRTGTQDQNANEQQMFVNALNKLQTGQQMTNADVQLLAALATQQQGINESQFGMGLQRSNALNQAGQNTYGNQVTAANMGNQNYLTDYQNMLNQYLTGTQLDAAGRQEARGNQWDVYNALTGQAGNLAQAGDTSGYAGQMGQVANQYGNNANAYAQIGQNQMAMLSPLASWAGRQLFGGNMGTGQQNYNPTGNGVTFNPQGYPTSQQSSMWNPQNWY
jgi:hypothetical protein